MTQLAGTGIRSARGGESRLFFQSHSNTIGAKQLHHLKGDFVLHAISSYWKAVNETWHVAKGFCRCNGRFIKNAIVRALALTFVNAAFNGRDVLDKADFGYSEFQYDVP